MILRLRLRNFRRYVDVEILFTSEGIILINGKNGVGKSTIIEAIEFALFGKVKSGTVIASIRNKNADIEDEVFVEVDVERNGHVYRIRRELTKKNATTGYVIDAPNHGNKDENDPYAKGTSGTTSFVEKILGMKHQAFIASVVARQKELDSLAGMQGEQRRKFFVSLLGLDVLDEVRPPIRADLRTAKSMSEALKNQMPDMSETIELLKTLKSNMKDLKKKQNEDKKSYDAAVQKAKKAEEKLSTHQQKYLEVVRLTDQIDTEDTAITKNKERIITLQDGLTTLEGQLGTRIVEDITDINSKIEVYENERSVFQQRLQADTGIKEANIRLGALEKDLATAQKKIDELRAGLPDGYDPAHGEAIRNTIEEITKKGTAEKTVLNMWQSQRDALDKLLEDVSSGNQAACPTCHTDLTQEGAADHLALEMKELDGRIATTTSNLKTMKRELIQARGELATFERDEAKASSVNVEVEGIKGGMKSKEEAAQEWREKLEGLQATVSELDTSSFTHKTLFECEDVLRKLRKKQTEQAEVSKVANAIAVKKGELEQAETSLTEHKNTRRDLVAKRNALHFDKDVYESVAEDHRVQKQAVETAREVMSKTDTDILLCDKDIETQQTNIEKVKELEDQLNHFSKEASELSLLDEIFLAMRVGLIGRVAPRLAETTSEFLCAVTDGLYQNVTLSDNYDVSVIMEEGEWPLAQFSGGEQDVVNLCMRLAISQMILEAKGLDRTTLILDETFGSQDPERRAAIIDIVSRLKEFFPQIILITHIEEVKDRADTTIEITMDNDGNATVVRAA